MYHFGFATYSKKPHVQCTTYILITLILVYFPFHPPEIKYDKHILDLDSLLGEKKTSGSHGKRKY